MASAAPAPGPWALWADGVAAPWYNMAVDEALLQELAPASPALLRYYGWDRPAVSIGYFQRHDTPLPPGFTLVRRPTGGGLVWHDRDLTFALLLPSTHPLCRQDRWSSYRLVHQALAEGLASIGLHCHLADDSAPVAEAERLQCFRSHARFDLMVGPEKLAGGAQRRTARGLLHQGSLLPATCSGLSREQLLAGLWAGWQRLLGPLSEPFTPTAGLLATATRLSTKYQDPAWTRRY